MAKQTGGNAFDKLLKDARKGGNTSISIGVQQGERYPDGTSVAQVAAAHEFGLGDAYEQAAFRRSRALVASDLKRARYLAGGAAGGGVAGGVSQRDTEQVADKAVERIKQSIAAAGLVKTGKLIRSITAEILPGRMHDADNAD